MNQTEAKPSARAWLTVAMLCVVGCLNYLDRNMITTMRLSVVAAVPMTEADFGLLTSVFLWVYGVLSPFSGFLADRIGRSRVILASLFIWSTLTWLTGQAKTFEQLLVVRALMGASEAGYLPAALALISDYHPGPTRSRATSLHVMAVVAGTGLGGVGGWLAERGAWNTPFQLFGLFGAAYAILLFFALRAAPWADPAEARNDAVHLGEAVRSLLSTPSFLLQFAGWGALGSVGWLLAGWSPTFFQEKFHLSQGQAGLSATGILGASAFVGAFIGGALADRAQRRNPRGRILVPVAGLLLAAPSIFLMAHAGAAGLALLGLALYGLTRTFVDANMMPMLCLVADPRYRATGFGLLTLCTCAVGGLSVYAGGLLRDARVGLDAPFHLAAGAILVAAAAYSFMRPRRGAAEPLPR